jgi:hypothetical protein
MAFVHGKNTVITVATNDLSEYTDNSELKRGANVHNLTPYGVDDEVNQGGLKKFEFTMSGTYDSTAGTGPRGTLVGNEGDTLAIVRKPEGTGTGKPNEAFNAVLEEYVETNPSNDFIKWSAKFTGTGAITDTTQA